MTKIRIKRVKRHNDNYEWNRLDERFVNGSVIAWPEVGQSLHIIFDRLAWGSWHTSPVVSMESKHTLIVLKTNNSVYHIKMGWED